MVQKLLGKVSINSVYWSLFIEIVFYVTCVGLFLARRLVDSRVLAAATILCVAGSVGPLIMNAAVGTVLPVQLLTYHLSFLIFGGLIRNAVAERQHGAAMPFLAATAVEFAVLPFASGIVVPLDPAQVPQGLEIGFLTGTFAAVVMFVAACRYAWPRGRLLVWLGTLSYSIYLLHTSALTLMLAIIPVSSLAAEVAYVLLTLGVTLLASQACYRWVEKPAIALGRQVRFGAMPAVRAAA